MIFPSSCTAIIKDKSENPQKPTNQQQTRTENDENLGGTNKNKLMTTVWWKQTDQTTVHDHLHRSPNKKTTGMKRSETWTWERSHGSDRSKYSPEMHAQELEAICCCSNNNRWIRRLNKPFSQLWPDAQEPDTGWPNASSIRWTWLEAQWIFWSIASEAAKRRWKWETHTNGAGRPRNREFLDAPARQTLLDAQARTSEAGVAGWRLKKPCCSERYQLWVLQLSSYECFPQLSVVPDVRISWSTISQKLFRITYECSQLSTEKWLM